MKTITGGCRASLNAFRGMKLNRTNFKRLAFFFILGFSPIVLTAQFSISFGVTEPTCWGGADGFITANVNGGASPYTFEWNTGQTTQTISGVRAGTYSVTVTDANENSKSASVKVVQPDQIKGTFSFSDCDYPTVVMVTAKGGWAPYTYKWENGSLGDKLEVTEPGKYCVTIIDANNCARVECVLVELSGLDISVNMDMVTCPGDTDGEIKVTIIEGTGPYTFEWSNGATGPINSNLAPGEYSVTVTDKAGCTATATGIVKDKPELKISCDFEDPVCAGDENGSIEVFVSGGTAPYSYLWNTGDTTSAVSGLGTGTYSVTVTDANGCIIEKEQVLFPLSTLVILGSATPESCPGENDGVLMVQGASGVMPYSYEWSNGAVSATVTDVAPGEYTVTVTDAAGCSKEATLVVEPAEPFDAVLDVTPISVCEGNDGMIEVIVSPDTAVVTYLWSTGDTTAKITDLGPGEYSVTVINDNECEIILDTILQAPPALAVEVNATKFVCPGDDSGQAMAMPIGGTAPYVYSWNNGDTTQAVAELTAGTYIVTVVDANECMAVDSVTISESAEILAIIDATATACGASSDGTATVIVDGGVAPYTYMWNTGDTTVMISDLSAGEYCVTVKDFVGCMKILCTTIQADSLGLTLVGTNIDCYGDSTGTVTASGVDGMEPYEYLWNTGDTTATLDSLTAGEYSVTVTDAKGCEAADTIVLTQPDTFKVVITDLIDVDCFGDSTGKVTVMAMGGTGPYTFSWTDGGSGSMMDDTMSDISDCPVPNPDPACAPPDLGEYTTIIDVAPNTSVSWNLGEKLTTQKVLIRGGGTVLVDDGNIILEGGIINVEGSEFVIENGNLQLTSPGAKFLMTEGILRTSSNVQLDEEDTFMCITDSQVEIGDETANDGFTNGTFADGSGYTSANFQNTKGYAYFEDVCMNVTQDWQTKDEGTTYLVKVYLEVGDATANNATETAFNSKDGDDSGNYENDGINGIYGTQIAIANGNFKNNKGTMTVCEVDVRVNGDGTGSFQVNDGTLQGTGLCIAANDLIQNQGSWTADVKAYWARNSGLPGSISGSVPADETSMDDIDDLCFEAFCTSSTSPIAESNMRDSLPAGVYKVIVTDSMGCMAMLEIEISQGDSIGLSIESTNLDCAGDSTGTISAFVTGGSKPITFAWSNGADTNELSDLAAGTYILTLTDANGCTVIDSVTLTEPDSLNLTITNLRGACEDIDNGELVVTATGGVEPYTYSWSNEAETDTIKKLMPGEYSVTVIDANGCIATLKTLVEEYPGLECTITILQNESSPGAGDGSATVDVIGGVEPFTYLWSDGQTTKDATELGAGDYSVTVTDANGCITSCEINLLILSGLGNYVWEDLDKDGIQDEDEPGVPGVPVKLKDIDNNIIARDTTDENGFYSFLDLLPDTYSVMFDIDSATYNYTIIDEGSNDSLDSDVNFDNMQMTPQVTLASGEINFTLDAGIYRRPAIGADPCECLNNATADGNGQFSERITVKSYPGETWKVVEVAGMYQPDSPEPPAAPIPIEPGTEMTEFAPGMYELPARLVDGEVYIALSAGNVGVDTVFTTNVCFYPRLNLDEIPGDSICVIDGSLELSSNPTIPGEVKYYLNGEEITEIDPSILEEGDYEFIAKLIPFDSSECEARIVKQITIHSGCVAGLGNYVWEDLNKDGIQDDNEPGVPDIPVKLKDKDDNIIARDTTDENGFYSFLNLAPDTYSVMFDIDSANYNYTILNAGSNDSLDNDVNFETMQMTPQVTLDTGEINNTLDAGIYLRPSIGADPCECLNNATADGNGQFSERITVKSYPGETWKVVEVAGMYQPDSPEPPAAPIPIEPGTEMTEFAPGMYELPARLVDGEVYIALSAGNVGVDTVFTTNVCFYPRLNLDEIPGDSICVVADPLVLSSNPTIPGEVKYYLNGEEITEIDPSVLEDGDYEFIAQLFPFDPNECEARIVKDITIHSECLAVIGDTVWLDQNRNGLQDPSEVGIGGVQVIAQQVGELSDSLDKLFRDTMFTDENGKYLFVVPPGVYKVTFGQPEGLTPTLANAGDDTKDSDADPGTGMTGLYTVNAGDVNLTIDAGFYNICVNVTDPGDIGYDQMLCGPGQDPDPIIELRAPEGGEGELEYLWMKSTISPIFNNRDWQPIPNSNTKDYDPGPLFETTYFTRCVRREGCVFYIEPTPVTIKVNEYNRIDIEMEGIACVGQPITLSLDTELTGPFTWEFDGPATPSTATGKSTVVTFNDFGSFEVRVYSNANGCIVSQRKTITVYNSPTFCGTELNIDLSVENERNVSIEWSVANDGTEYIFEVERSEDGYNFEKIATVTEPKALINDYKHYEYMDKEAKKGRNYYQVKIYEQSLGNLAFTSDMEEVIVYGESKLLLVYPNPVVNDLKIEVFESLGEPIQVELFSINGILLQRHELEAETQGLELNLENYPKGTYFLKVQFGKTLVKRYKLVRY